MAKLRGAMTIIRSASKVHRKLDAKRHAGAHRVAAAAAGQEAADEGAQFDMVTGRRIKEYGHNSDAVWMEANVRFSPRRLVLRDCQCRRCQHAALIQCCYKGMLGRNAAKAERRSGAAAEAVQAAVRGWLQRSGFSAKAKALHELAADAAAAAAAAAAEGGLAKELAAGRKQLEIGSAGLLAEEAARLARHEVERLEVERELGQAGQLPTWHGWEEVSVPEVGAAAAAPAGQGGAGAGGPEQPPRSPPSWNASPIAGSGELEEQEHELRRLVSFAESFVTETMNSEGGGVSPGQQQPSAAERSRLSIGVYRRLARPQQAERARPRGARSTADESSRGNGSAGSRTAAGLLRQQRGRPPLNQSRARSQPAAEQQYSSVSLRAPGPVGVDDGQSLARLAIAERKLRRPSSAPPPRPAFAGSGNALGSAVAGSALATSVSPSPNASSPASRRSDDRRPSSAAGLAEPWRRRPSSAYAARCRPASAPSRQGQGQGQGQSQGHEQGQRRGPSGVGAAAASASTRRPWSAQTRRPNSTQPGMRRPLPSWQASEIIAPEGEEGGGPGVEGQQGQQGQGLAKAAGAEVWLANLWRLRASSDRG